MIPRLFIGHYNGAPGLKTALPGFDVTNTADDNDRGRRSFNSQWANLAKVALLGKALAVTTGTVVLHGLGYAPYFEARVWRPADNAYFDDDYENSPGTLVGSNVMARRGTAIDTVNLTLRAFPSVWCSYLIWTIPVNP